MKRAIDKYILLIKVIFNIFPFRNRAKAKIIPKAEPIIGPTLNMYAIDPLIKDILDMPRTKFIIKLGLIILPNAPRILS